MFDTSEYYGGLYPSPCEEKEEKEFDRDTYEDYLYDSYRDNLLLKESEDE